MSLQKPRNTESWRIALDKETNRVFAFNPSFSQMSLIRGAGSYEELGTLYRKEDAQSFCLYKQIGCEPDAVAFLKLERELRQHILEAAGTIDEETLRQMVRSVREDTGRSCFGTCQSLSGIQACAICFSELNNTWELCAKIRCIMALNNGGGTKQESDSEPEKGSKNGG